MNTVLIGAYGEELAGRYLRENGYDILSANYRCRLGEIDIIACDSEYIMFVEVKTRAYGSMIDAKEAVDKAKQKRLVATANFYLSKHKLKLQPRFDVCEVYMENGKLKEINYIKNAYSE